MDCIANNVDVLLYANLSCSSKSHRRACYPARWTEGNFIVKLVAIQKDSVHCFVGFCCTHDLLSSVWLGFAGWDNVVWNNSTCNNHCLFWTDTGIFEFHPEPLAVLLENQGSETCSKGNTHEFWVLVSYLETEELSFVKKRGEGLCIMKIEPKSLQSSATTSQGSSPPRFSTQNGGLAG